VVQMCAGRIGQDRLDDVAVGDQRPQSLGSVLGIDRRVNLPDGLQTSRLHLGNGLALERLTVREPCRAGLVLHRSPHRVFGKLLERTASPGSVATLAEAFVGAHGDLDQGTRHDLRGLNATLQWAGDNRTDRKASQSLSQIRSLTPPDIVKANALGPSGEGSVGV